MKDRKYPKMRNYNFSIMKEETTENDNKEKYILTVSRHYDLCEDLDTIYKRFYVTKEDLVSIVKAVRILHDLPLPEKVRRKYLTGVHYDKKVESVEFRREKGFFNIYAERRQSLIIPDFYRQIFKLEFEYLDAFWNKESFNFVFDHRDFLALGILAARVLDPDNDIEEDEI